MFLAKIAMKHIVSNIAQKKSIFPHGKPIRKPKNQYYQVDGKLIDIDSAPRSLNELVTNNRRIIFDVNSEPILNLSQEKHQELMIGFVVYMH